MSHTKKLEAATRGPAYLEYSQMIGAAIVRAALGQGTLDEVAQLQREQARVVADIVEGES